MQFGRSDQHGGKTASSVHLTAKAQSRDRAKAGLAEPMNHDQFHLVPNHIVVSAEGNISKKPTASAEHWNLTKWAPLSTGVHLKRNQPERLRKGSECSPWAWRPPENSSRPDHGPDSKLSSLLVDSHLEMTCNSSFQDKTLRNSSKEWSFTHRHHERVRRAPARSPAH